MNYPGGKGAEGVYQAIVNQIPRHRVYIEAFLGGGAILRHKRPSQISYGVEVNRQTFEAWQTAECGFSAASVGRDNYHNCDKLARGSLTVYNTDFLKFARNLHNILDQRSTFIYLDPPYVQEVRSGNKRIYDSEFSDWFSHEELLAYILTLKCNVMISGYEHPVYDSRLSDWRKLSFQGLTRGGRAVETIWMNYAEPAELHDYRYVGDNYRERENIRKVQKNLVAKLQRMQPLHRLAVLDVLNDRFSRTAENGGAADVEIMPATIAETDDDAGHSHDCVECGQAFLCMFQEREERCIEFPCCSPECYATMAIDATGFVGRDHVQHPTRNAGALTATNGDAGSRESKKLKTAVAFDYLAEHYWSEEDIAAALTAKDPRTHLVNTPCRDKWRGNGSVSFTIEPGGKIHIRLGHKEKAGVSFVMTIDKLARKVLDLHASGAPFEAELNWPPEKDLIAAHGDQVNDCGVFNDHCIETVTLKAKGKLFVRVLVAHSESLDKWFYSYQFQLGGREWHGGGGLPSVSRDDCTAATREEAIEKATAQLHKQDDISRFLNSRDRAPSKKAVSAATVG